MNFTAKLDLTKIDKSKLFKSEKTGAIYLDLLMIESPNNQYGQSHMIVQDVSKEDREKGIKGAILGNAKELVKQESTTTSTKVQDDDLPF
jgi:hypothetical protein